MTFLHQGSHFYKNHLMRLIESSRHVEKMEDNIYMNFDHTKVCVEASDDIKNMQPLNSSKPPISAGYHKAGRIGMIVSVVLIIMLAASLVTVTVIYFQVHNYLKNIEKESRKIMVSFSMDKSSNTSEHDVNGLRMLGHLSTFQTMLQMFKANAENASRDQSLVNSFEGFFSLPTNPWRWKSDNLYYFSKEKKSWSESEFFCRSFNSHLTSVLTAEEQGYLSSTVGPGSYWLGLTKSEKMWRFVDGSEFNQSISFWEEHQPDNFKDEEDCVEIRFQDKWNDRNCNNTNKWICKMPL
ncbi:C-type lectin domain family 4 member K-like isoform X2 [Lissotriton helveticus]